MSETEFQGIVTAFASFAPKIALAPIIPVRASFFNNPFAVFEARVHGRDTAARQFSHNLLAVGKFPSLTGLMACFLGVTRFAFPGVIKAERPIRSALSFILLSIRRPHGRVNGKRDLECGERKTNNEACGIGSLPEWQLTCPSVRCLFVFIPGPFLRRRCPGPSGC